MKKWLAILTLAFLCTGSLAQAQCFDDPDEICIFWTSDCDQCINCMAYMAGPVTAYVVLMNSSWWSGVSGFEFQLVNANGSGFYPPPSDFIVGYNLPVGGINVSAPPEFIVGLGMPLPPDPCTVLVSIDILVFDPSSWCFGVKPVSVPSIPGQMAYVPGHDPSLLTQMNPCTGINPADYGMACLNSPDCPPPVATDKTSWDGLKSLYR